MPRRTLQYSTLLEIQFKIRQGFQSAIYVLVNLCILKNSFWRLLKKET